MDNIADTGLDITSLIAAMREEYAFPPAISNLTFAEETLYRKLQAAYDDISVLLDYIQDHLVTK